MKDKYITNTSEVYEKEIRKLQSKLSNNTNDLYYITYSFESSDESIVYGEVYALDTGYGILELGIVERNREYLDQSYYPNKTIEQYLNEMTGDVIESVKVL